MAWLRHPAPREVCARAPQPADAGQRQPGSRGLARFCAGTEWDAFYVVTGSGVVKFGITTGDGRHRLLTHAGQGYTEVMRL